MKSQAEIVSVLSVDEILDGLKEKLGISKDADLARELGIEKDPSQNVYNWRNRKKIQAWDEIHKLCAKRNLSLDEIILGQKGGESKRNTYPYPEEHREIHEQVHFILNSGADLGEDLVARVKSLNARGKDMQELKAMMKELLTIIKQESGVMRTQFAQLAPRPRARNGKAAAK